MNWKIFLLINIKIAIFTASIFPLDKSIVRRIFILTDDESDFVRSNALQLLNDIGENETYVLEKAVSIINKDAGSGQR